MSLRVEILRNGSLQVEGHDGWAEDKDRPINTFTLETNNSFLLLPLQIEILKNGSLQDKYSLSQGDMDGPIVPVNETITADGVQRNVILVNDQFPGPTLEVMEGAQVNHD